MRFGILGPLEVADDGGRRVELGGHKQRSVLAILLLHANEGVSSDRLVEDLWSGGPPASAAGSLQAQVSRLRRALGDGQRIVTSGGGYLLRVAPGELDRELFARLVEEGGAAVSTEDWELASGKLREALGLWRGPPLSDFQYDSFAQGEIARLAELHVGALEQRIEAELALGREATVIGDLERLVREHPYRERLRGQSMLALYRTGRQAEALAAYRKARRVLAEELGIEPSFELRELHDAILRQDPSLLRPGARVDRAGREQVRRGDAASSPVPEEPPAAREDSGERSPAALLSETKPPRQARKVVTALFCYVTGSTALGEQLDPEVLREVFGRYLAEITAIIERHGGTVEKFIGDAVMAVFGVPRVREDDALRAVRAAAEIRERLPVVAADVAVELRFRTGVNTGPLLMAEGENLAVGDAVNVAARLEQAAEPGEILIGEETLRLVRDAVRVQQLESLELLGKAQGVAAYRLVSVDPAAPGFARHFDLPLVGREDELRLLREVWERVGRESGCYLFTLLGMAGVGKSRLAAELLDGIAAQATVLRGRCLHYGEGITFWPLLEALTAVGERAEHVLQRLDSGSMATPEELFWEVRRVIEALAAEAPVALHIDDLQWAEPTLLDLLDHVADLSRGAPILLLCTARPELLEERPNWAGGKLNATTLLLEPLATADSEVLLDELGYRFDPDARAQVIAASEGNPLFLEETAALARERGTVEVPPTIQALLAARLERLPIPEREVLERGAVEGEVFHRLAVSALADEQPPTEVESRLVALLRKELIRPHPPTLEGDEAFRFRHLLIRDAAYDALPKSTRARLHERFATWLEQHAPDLIELDELAGWHLEQTIRYQQQLARDGDPRLVGRAAEHLYAGGKRAASRQDLPAARNLLARAQALVPPEESLRPRIAVALAETLVGAGEYGEVEELLLAAEADRDAAPYATLIRLDRLFALNSEDFTQRVRSLLPTAIKELERRGDQRGLAKAHLIGGLPHWSACQFTAAAAEFRLAIEHARAAGDDGLREQALGWYVTALRIGPVSATEIVRELDVIEAEQPGPYLAYRLDYVRAFLASFAGCFDEARSLMQRAGERLHAMGYRAQRGGNLMEVGRIELAAGNPSAARAALLESDAILADLGERGHRASTQAQLAATYEQLGEPDAARAAIDLAEALGGEDDLDALITTTSVRARLALADEYRAEAERWARRAVEYSLRTDYIVGQGETRMELARVLVAADRCDEAAAEARDALELFEAKGDQPNAAKARGMLDHLKSQ